MKRRALFALTALSLSLSADATDLTQRFIQISAKTKEERTQAVNAGMSIEFVRSDSAWGFADARTIHEIESHGLHVLGNFDEAIGRGGHGDRGKGFPSEDSRFHDYAEVRAELRRMEKENPKHAKVHTIGKSLEGREILAIQLNTDTGSLERGQSQKPGMIFLGAHHAREHLSSEIPLMLADYLLKNKTDPKISSLLDGRDVWFVPLVNPDGSEYDIESGRYLSWRKNRRPNGDGTSGVDLNRNYGYQWGTGGSSTNTNSDVYMGPKPFSEPETQVMKSFVESHLNARILLSFHTFSELILYPWGHKYDGVENEKDHSVFVTMAKTMAQWNRYKPQQASQLYIASGDTTDWAYGEHGIFAFTFELSPASIWSGGFYPGAKVIDPTFAANLKPALYMLELADDPYRAAGTTPPGRRPGSTWPNPISARNKFEIHPIYFDEKSR